MMTLFPRLRERSNQAAGTLSGGEQQMVAMARALMGRPRVLCMDEPTMGLSPLFVDHVLELIQTVNKTGVTVFMVEQNANLAHCGSPITAMCSRPAALHYPARRAISCTIRAFATLTSAERPHDDKLHDPGPASLAELEARFRRDLELLVMPPDEGLARAAHASRIRARARCRHRRRRHVRACRRRSRSSASRSAACACSTARPRASRARGRPEARMETLRSPPELTGPAFGFSNPHVPRLVRGAVRRSGVEEGAPHPAPAMDGLSALVPPHDRRADRERDRAHRSRRRQGFRAPHAALARRHAQGRGAARRAGERPRRARRALRAAAVSRARQALRCAFERRYRFRRARAARPSA